MSETVQKFCGFKAKPRGCEQFLPRADCDAPCLEQLKATHLRASPKQQALLDVLLQLIKTWPLTIGPWPEYSLILEKKLLDTASINKNDYWNLGHDYLSNLSISEKYKFFPKYKMSAFYQDFLYTYIYKKIMKDEEKNYWFWRNILSLHGQKLH